MGGGGWKRAPARGALPRATAQPRGVGAGDGRAGGGALAPALDNKGGPGLVAGGGNSWVPGSTLELRALGQPGAPGEGTAPSLCPISVPPGRCWGFYTRWSCR